MFVFCKDSTYMIGMLMKKMNLAGNPCMYMSMQR